MAAQVRQQQQVGRRQQGHVAAHILLGQDVDHLCGDTDKGVQGLAPRQRSADIDRNDSVCTKAPGDIDRQVVDQAAITEHTAIALDRREHSRYRHARAQCRGQIALAEDNRVAGFEVRRHGAKRRWQFVKPFNPPGVVGVSTQGKLQGAT